MSCSKAAWSKTSLEKPCSQSKVMGDRGRRESKAADEGSHVTRRRVSLWVQWGMTEGPGEQAVVRGDQVQAREDDGSVRWGRERSTFRGKKGKVAEREGPARCSHLGDTGSTTGPFASKPNSAPRTLRALPHTFQAQSCARSMHGSTRLFGVGGLLRGHVQCTRTLDTPRQ